MNIPLQFASLNDGQEVFVWSDCLLDLGTDFLVGTTDDFAKFSPFSPILNCPLGLGELQA